MEKVVIILTCFNRKEKTIKCLDSIMSNNKNLDITFVVVDDASTDGTSEAIKEKFANADVVAGSGSLFWNGGMHVGMEHALKNYTDANLYVLINDDVEFDANIFDEMAQKIKENTGKDAKAQVLVGATRSDEGTLSYGGIKYAGGKSIKLRFVGPDEEDTVCDTFNANCVFLTREVFLKAKSTDPAYSHSMGDFDYGFTIKRLGYKIKVFNKFVGSCNDNPTDNTWQDRKLSRIKRIKLKEGRKGLPFKDWFRYLRKNFGLDVAIVRSFTPYIKILLGR